MIDFGIGHWSNDRLHFFNRFGFWSKYHTRVRKSFDRSVCFFDEDRILLRLVTFTCRKQQVLVYDGGLLDPCVRQGVDMIVLVYLFSVFTKKLVVILFVPYLCDVQSFICFAHPIVQPKNPLALEISLWFCLRRDRFKRERPGGLETTGSNGATDVDVCS